MPTMDRRDFIKGAGAVLARMVLPRIPPPMDPLWSTAPPAPLGRITTWQWQGVYSEPTHESERVTWKTKDEIIPLYASVLGEAPWPNNPIWYQTAKGYIHSGYVQPVENTPSTEVIAAIVQPGFWAQVCVPIAEARWQPAGRNVALKLYYGTVYRVVKAAADADGNWWYQLKEGVTYSPGPYVPAWSVRRVPPEELAPISPGRSDKRIEINIAAQTLACLEGETTVFSTPISSGAAGAATPRGEYRVLYKRHTSRMIGGEEENRYDLPGVAFPTYFTRSAIAVHGTYWHNDFVRQHSHGCVNVPNSAAQWVFRWTDPVVPYEAFRVDATPQEATRIIVV
jgi:lipoprotein-anchoring transpeptidase ErfK/SrfK